MTGRQINQGAVKGSQGAPESRDLEGHCVSSKKPFPIFPVPGTIRKFREAEGSPHIQSWQSSGMKK